MHQFLPYRPERDVYRLLQVDPTADAERITAACRHLARHFHPDRNGSPRANEEMQVVNAVRELLTDPATRAAYDGSRRRYLEGLVKAGPNPAPSRGRVAGPPQPLPAKRPVALIASSAATAAVVGARRLEMTVRAALRGLRAAMVEMGPSRCPRCRDLIDDDDRYCGGCGTWLGRGEAAGADAAGDPPHAGRFGVGSADL